jgi:hypothetical protein
MYGMKRQRLLWMMNRMRSMPPAELPHRLRERLRQHQDRRGWFSPPELPRELEDSPLPHWALLGTALPREDWLGSLERDTESILSDRWKLLGTTWPTGGRNAWHLDPITGGSWPSDEPAFSIDYRHSHGGKDPKLCWELQKLQLQTLLAMGHRFLGSSRAEEACRGDLHSWLGQNSPYMGIGYASNIETSIRTVSLLLLISLLGPESFGEGQRKQLWRNLHWNAVWLRRYPSLFSSAANHRTGELAGLLMLESLAPQLPGADWRSRLRDLQTVAQRQFHPDGVGKEQSVHYQAFTTEHMLIAHQCAARAGIDSGLLPLMEKSASFLRALMDSSGQIPQLGDGDESSVLKQSLPAESLPYSICGAVAGVSGRAELAPPGWRQDLRCLLLGVPDIQPRESALESRSFPDGGYTVLRREECVLTLDHGPLGFPGTAGHGHADALSTCMHHRGEPVWVDWGTYRYNGAPAWRQWARSTAAHNTVVLDGRCQSSVSGPFNWSLQAEAGLIETDLSESRAKAEHNGYLKTAGVRHTREVKLSSTGITQRDHLAGGGMHRVELNLHLAPGWEVRKQDDGWMILKEGREAALLTLRGANIEGEIVVDGTRPGAGSHSKEYNEVEPSTCMRWRGMLELPASWLLEWEWLGDWRIGI